MNLIWRLQVILKFKNKFSKCKVILLNNSYLACLALNVILKIHKQYVREIELKSLSSAQNHLNLQIIFKSKPQNKHIKNIFLSIPSIPSFLFILLKYKLTNFWMVVTSASSSGNCFDRSQTLNHLLIPTTFDCLGLRLLDYWVSDFFFWSLGLDLMMFIDSFMWVMDSKWLLY